MAGLTLTQVETDIRELSANLSARETKYIRNYNRYMNNGMWRDTIRNITSNPPQGYWYNSAYPDTGPLPMLNILRSMIDTICSRLAETRVRPFFNPIDGTWETRKVARETQHFFDLYFDNQNLAHKSIMCRRDSLIFEIGNIWLDDDEADIRRVPPWAFLYDRAEMSYDRLTRCAVKLHSYPLSALRNQKWLNADLKEKILAHPVKKAEWVIYYDLWGGKKHYFVEGEHIGEKKITFESLPVVWTFYSDPVKGSFTTSLIDNQYTVQTMIDAISERIELAVELSPANFTLLPRNSNLKRSMFTNEIGAAYEYDPSPFVPNTPEVYSPPPISGEYLEILKYWMQLGYNLEGVSQLSAQSVKPAGLDSGVALQTVQDIESDRFEVVLQNQIKFQMDITDRLIDVMPDDAPMMPEQLGRADIKWSQVRKQRKNMSIQFAPASALSKDPQTKMQQVEKLMAMKIIPPEDAPEYLEFPDLEKLESNLTAANDVIEKLIDNAIENADFTYDDVVPGQMLEQQALVMLFRLIAVDEKEEKLDNLRQFLTIVQQKNVALRQAENPPEPPAPPQAPPMEPPRAPGPTNNLPIEGAPPSPNGTQQPAIPAGLGPGGPRP